MGDKVEMITQALSDYAEQTARECGADAGEILLLISMGCRVPEELHEDAEAFREAVRSTARKVKRTFTSMHNIR